MDSYLQYTAKFFAAQLMLVVLLLSLPKLSYADYAPSDRIDNNRIDHRNILNSIENAELDEINTAWKLEYDVINLDNSIDYYNTNMNQLNFINTVIENNEIIIKDNLTIFNKMVLGGNYDEALSNILKSKSEEQKINFEKQVELKKSLSTLESDIESLRVKLKVLNEIKNKKVIALYNKIKDRFSSQANTQHTSMYSSKTKCDEYQSIMSCLKSQKTAMKNTFKNTMILPLKVNVNNFEVLDATQSMSGELSFDAEISYTLSYNQLTDDIIRDLLSLDKFQFTLSSTHQGARYYINNDFVGSGKSLEISGDYMGVNDVRAEFSERSQSLKINFEPNGTYFFPFEVGPDRERIKEQLSLAKKKIIHSNSESIYITSYEEDDLYLFDSKSANNFCKVLLSALPAKTEDYSYLNQAGLLTKNAYWMESGELFQSHLAQKRGVKKRKHPIVCVIDIFQRTPVLSMEKL